MIVTLTSKGQLTLPKAIREAMQLDAGSKLDFSVQEDGSLRARPMRPVSSLSGILHRPGMKAVSVERMNEARDAHVAEDDRRIKAQAAAQRGASARRAR